MLLNQNTDEALQTANNGPMQHDGTVPSAIFTHEFGVESFGHVRVDLHRATLPLAAKGVFQGVFNLRSVERTLAWRQFEFAARCLQTGSQCLFGFVPAFFGSDALVRARCQLVNDLGKSKVPVHLLQQRGECDTFRLDLVFGAKMWPSSWVKARTRMMPCSPQMARCDGSCQTRQNAKAGRGNS